MNRENWIATMTAISLSKTFNQVQFTGDEISANGEECRTPGCVAGHAAFLFLKGDQQRLNDLPVMSIPRRAAEFLGVSPSWIDSTALFSAYPGATWPVPFCNTWNQAQSDDGRKAAVIAYMAYLLAEHDRKVREEVNKVTMISLIDEEVKLKRQIKTAEEILESLRLDLQDAKSEVEVAENDLGLLRSALIEQGAKIERLRKGIS